MAILERGMFSIEQLYPRQPCIITAFNSFLVLQTENEVTYSPETDPPNQFRIWKQPDNMSKRAYKELPIVKKVELLKESGNKSVRQLAKDYGVSVGTVSNMLKRKREIEEQYEANVGAVRCRKLQY